MDHNANTFVIIINNYSNRLTRVHVCVNTHRHIYVYVRVIYHYIAGYTRTRTHISVYY